MSDQKQAILRLDAKNTDSGVELGRQTAVLRENLNRFTDIRASNVSESLPPNDGVENKGDLMLLSTLAITFVSTGTAKALIDAVRALLSSSRDSSLKATLHINNREIEITSQRLDRSQVDDLIRLIDFEVRS